MGIKSKSAVKGRIRHGNYYFDGVLRFNEILLILLKFMVLKCKQVFGCFALKADHIEPVVDPEVGFVSIGEYAERLFCSADNYQMLCKPCHDFKSKKENALRRRLPPIQTRRQMHDHQP